LKKYLNPDTPIAKRGGPTKVEAKVEEEVVKTILHFSQTYLPLCKEDVVYLLNRVFTNAWFSNSFS
jgi:hypothetical protein